jgi:hypothetical protein
MRLRRVIRNDVILDVLSTVTIAHSQTSPATSKMKAYFYDNQAVSPDPMAISTV